MTDNVPLDVCDEPELNPYLGIPTEMWTNIFKLLSRRILVLQVQPVNRVFKQICDKNVNSIHVIENARELIWTLTGTQPKANEQMTALTGNKCNLAGQFRMTKYGHCHNSEGMNKASLAILHHCMDLFQAIQMNVHHGYPDKHVAQLALLERAKPVYIKLVFDKMRAKEEWELFMRHPAVISCSRLAITGSVWTMALYQWLHHHRNKPTGLGSAEDVEPDEEPLRCLIFPDVENGQSIEGLLDFSVCHFRQAQGPSHRRHFLFAFKYPVQTVQHLFGRSAGKSLVELDNTSGRINNLATGEVLLLERLMGENGQPTDGYRLLRCMASQVANGTEELYGKVFKPDGEFNIGEDGQQGKEPVSVAIF